MSTDGKKNRKIGENSDDPFSFDADLKRHIDDANKVKIKHIDHPTSIEIILAFVLQSVKRGKMGSNNVKECVTSFANDP